MIQLLVARALRRGLWEGSRPWMVIGVLVGLVRLMQRDADEEPVFSQRVEEGQTLTITLRPGD